MAVLPAGFGESLILQIFVLKCKDQNSLCKHYNHYFPVKKQNSGLIKAAEVTSKGMSVCDLKEKLDYVKEIQQGMYIVYHCERQEKWRWAKDL